MNVINVKDKQAKAEAQDAGLYVYIGRGSKWGNPFKIGRDGSREEVIKKYENYIMNKPELLAGLHELRGKTLGCYCKPAACHGDVLARLAKND